MRQATHLTNSRSNMANHTNAPTTGAAHGSECLVSNNTQIRDSMAHRLAPVDCASQQSSLGRQLHTTDPECITHQCDTTCDRSLGYGPGKILYSPQKILTGSQFTLAMALSTTRGACGHRPGLLSASRTSPSSKNMLAGRTWCRQLGWMATSCIYTWYMHNHGQLKDPTSLRRTLACIFTTTAGRHWTALISICQCNTVRGPNACTTHLQFPI